MDIVTKILANWETITLIITNVAALFVKPPVKRKRRTRAEDLI
jgi:hypothetical protein